MKEFRIEDLSPHEQLATHDHAMHEFLDLSKLLDCGSEFEIITAAVETIMKQNPNMSDFDMIGEYVSYEQQLRLRSNKPHSAGRGGGHLGVDKAIKVTRV